MVLCIHFAHFASCRPLTALTELSASCFNFSPIEIQLLSAQVFVDGIAADLRLQLGGNVTRGTYASDWSAHLYSNTEVSLSV